jgi:hypothetical protein
MLFFKDFSYSSWFLLKIVAFIILCKVKYSLYFGAQKGYSEMHFFVDRLMKKWGFRKGYHLVHKIFRKMGAVYNLSNRISY